MNLVLNVSKTDAADPVQLINISPRHLDGCFKPKRAKTLALKNENKCKYFFIWYLNEMSKIYQAYPAPSPNPITYFTCK